MKNRTLETIQRWSVWTQTDLRDLTTMKLMQAYPFYPIITPFKVDAQVLFCQTRLESDFKILSKSSTQSDNLITIDGTKCARTDF